jgi:tetratricopeptide (TPR) repeat protein
MGLWFAQKGEAEKAIEYYKKAIEIDPEYVFAHGRLALVLGNQGRFDEALEQCLIVLKHRPDDKEMYCNVGVLLEKKGQINEAIEYYQKSLQVDPNYEKARGLLTEAMKKKEGRQDVSGK